GGRGDRGRTQRCHRSHPRLPRPDQGPAAHPRTRRAHGGRGRPDSRRPAGRGTHRRAR
ncbi:MAG TPA: DNA ligase, partial [Streptomyces sp.]|nr:DNA ligase [Streptomyces sp.]